jgi:uncharacterized membrane protein
MERSIFLFSEISDMTDYLDHADLFSLVQAALLLSKTPQGMVGEPIEANRLYDAVNVILSLMVCLFHC